MAWIDTQVARGHQSSAEDYLVQLVEKERARQEWLRRARRAVAEARAAGISVRPPSQIVAHLGRGRGRQPDPARLAMLRADIAAARDAGPSAACAADILDRVLGSHRRTPVDSAA
jgi:Arc/MetJ-type ribon-helix-helix transcriptional regulator